MNVVKSSKIVEGVEVNQRFTCYMSKHEYSTLQRLLFVLYPPEPSVVDRVNKISVEEMKKSFFDENQQKCLLRMLECLTNNLFN